MYANQPRTEHLLNFRRNLVLAAELVAAGVPAVPNIYWFRKEDLDRYVAWAEDVGPPALAVNLQTFRTEDDWVGTALPGLTYLSLCLSEQTKLVFTGGTRPNRLADLGPAVRRPVVVRLTKTGAGRPARAPTDGRG